MPSIADDEEALKNDLTAVIALHGLPCGQVVAVKVQADNDYAASCKDGKKQKQGGRAPFRACFGSAEPLAG